MVKESLTEKASFDIEPERRERKRERIPSRLYTVSVEPDAGLEPTNREIMT